MIKLPYDVGISPPLYTEPFLIYKKNEDKTCLCVYRVDSKLKSVTLPMSQIRSAHNQLPLYYNVKINSSKNSSGVLGTSKDKDDLISKTFTKYEVVQGHVCKIDGKTRDTILVPNENGIPKRFLLSDVEFIPHFSLAGIMLPKDRTIRVNSEVICRNNKGLGIPKRAKGKVIAIDKKPIEMRGDIRTKIPDTLTIKLQDGNTIRSRSTKFKVI